MPINVYAKEDDAILQEVMTFFCKARRVPWHDELLEWHARQYDWLPEFQQVIDAMRAP